MILLNQSNKTDRLYQALVGPIPGRALDSLSCRQDTFNLFMRAELWPSFDMIGMVTEEVEAKYGLYTNLKEAVKTVDIIARAGLCLEFIIYTMYTFCKENKLIPIPISKRNIEIGNTLFNDPLLKQSATLIKEVLNIHYTKLPSKQEPIRTRPSTKEEGPLGILIWVLTYFSRIISAGVIDSYLSSPEGKALIVQVTPDKIGFHTNGTWSLLSFSHLNKRHDDFDKVTFKHLILDNRTYFEVKEDVLIMHDDFIPKFNLMDITGKVINTDETSENEAYYCEVYYPQFKAEELEGVEIEFKSILGCSFKEPTSAITNGKAKNQFIVFSKEFKFKAKTKDRSLPHIFIHNMKDIDPTNLPWIDDEHITS